MAFDIVLRSQTSGSFNINLAQSSTIYPKLNVNGSWVTPTEVYVYANGQWNLVTSVQVFANNTWNNLVS
jgi:hypothetical protein